jgi:hypothetical protein
MLAVLYSYNNKSRVHAKHIMIMNMFCVIKRKKISKFKSYVLSKNVLTDPLTKGWPPNVFREYTIDMSFMLERMILDTKG